MIFWVLFTQWLICIEVGKWLKQEAKLLSAPLPWQSHIPPSARERFVHAIGFFISCNFLRTHFFRFLCVFFCCFLFASTHFASWVLISYLQKNITLTSVCRKLFKVIKTSDVQTLLPMWQVPNLWAIFYSYQKRNLTSNQDSKDKDYSQILTSSSQNKKQMCRMANQIAG